MNKNIIVKDKFSIKFDTGTPRPHLIVLFNQACPIKPNISSLLLEHREIRNELIELALEGKYLNEKDFECSKVFSVHIGGFQSDSHFHAHICIDEDVYLELYREKVLKADQDIKPTRDLYIKKVIEYKSNMGKKCLQYKNEDTKSIQENPPQLNSSISSWNILFQSNFQIILHVSEPKIGFQLLNNNSPSKKDFIQIFGHMVAFAKEQSLFQKSKGAHLCLCLDTKSRLNAFNNNSVAGYILVKAQDFYVLHANKQEADSWLEKFESLSEYNILT